MKTMNLSKKTRNISAIGIAVAIISLSVGLGVRLRPTKSNSGGGNPSPFTEEQAKEKGQSYADEDNSFTIDLVDFTVNSIQNESITDNLNGTFHVLFEGTTRSNHFRYPDVTLNLLVSRADVTVTSAWQFGVNPSNCTGI